MALAMNPGAGLAERRQREWRDDLRISAVFEEGNAGREDASPSNAARCPVRKQRCLRLVGAPLGDAGAG
jgi:hypothetical protein